MTCIFVSRHRLLLAGLVALAGCAAAPRQIVAVDGDPAQAQQQREQWLAGTDHWQLEGRLGISDGRHGGSGQLSWTQDGEHYAFELRGPVFGPSFKLSGGPEGAVLTGLEKSPLRGPDAESLMRRALGWDLPLSELKAWVLGLRAQGRPAQLDFGANGLPAQLTQDGWQVRYPTWDTYRQPPLPSKVFAAKPPYSVRLSIEHWRLDH